MLSKKIFDIGIILLILAGAMMLINSGVFYFNYVRQEGALVYLTQDSPQVLGHVFFLYPASAFTFGITLIVLTYFGLKEKLIWAWFLSLLIGFFVPLTVLVSQIMSNIVPLGFVVLIFSVPGIALTGPFIFKSDK